MTHDAVSASLCCSKCGAVNSSKHLVLHHFVCAYVGPDYDFKAPNDITKCPKCHRTLTKKNSDWEVVGESQYCHDCGHEEMIESDQF